MEKLTIERTVKTTTVFHVEAATPKEAFEAIKSNKGIEIASTTKTEILIRDYPQDH